MNDLLQAIKNHIEQTLTNQLKHINYTIKAISTSKPRYIHYRINNDKQNISCFLWIYKDLSIQIETICGEKDLTLEGKEQEDYIRGYKLSYEITKTIPKITLTLNEPHSLDTITAITKENTEIIQNPITLRAIILGPEKTTTEQYEEQYEQISHLKETSKALKRQPHIINRYSKHKTLLSSADKVNLCRANK
jgi:hypothetical protein